ncbi:MAG: PIN/TRAM domain-containing protein [Fimbriimonadaceae bacterium]
MTKARLGLILAFGIAGAILFAQLMPVALGWLYDFVQEQNRPATNSSQIASPVRTSDVNQAPEDDISVVLPGREGEVQAEEQAADPGEEEEVPADQEEAEPSGQTEVPAEQGEATGRNETASTNFRPSSIEDDIEQTLEEYEPDALTQAALALLGFVFGLGIGNIVARNLEQLAHRWDEMHIGDKVNLFLGIFAGIVASIPFLFALQGLGGLVAPIATLGLMLGFSTLAVMALRSMSEVLPWTQHTVSGKRSGIKVLDTNVLIDGRIYDLARTGFLEGEIYVPSFVLQELQHIADSSDSLRRQRGRRGLEILRHLQSEFTVEVGKYDRYANDPDEEVDSRLVRIAKAVGGDLVSNDFNLNRVARIQEVQVLNINDLALSLRPNVLPGETLEVTVIREGNQAGQGVAYLEDGTMVVVEHGKRLMNETHPVEVTQVIQTERGKMIFACAMNESTKR